MTIDKLKHWSLAVPAILSLTLTSCSQPTVKDPPREASTSEANLGPAFPAGKLIDLSYPFDEQTIFWPTELGFRLERGPAGVTEKGYYYAANRFSTAEHGGTHIDAPIHFYKDQLTVDKIPLERFIGEGALVDVAQQCQSDPDYLVRIDDLKAWEAEHGRSLQETIVLLRTGFGRYWPDRKRYLGTKEHGPEAVAKLHFPGLDPEAARWLVEVRAIKAVGIDTASIDRGQSKQFGSHVALCQRGVPAFENVAYLDRLPATGFTIIALPMKIAGGSGGPLRIVAIVPDGKVSRPPARGAP